MAPSRHLLALLVCLLGCGPSFLRGPLEPIPRAASEQPLYAQVRTFGVAHAQSPFPVGDDVQQGLTLDLHHRGTQPVELDLATGALVLVPVDGGPEQVARVVGAGDGDLPLNATLVKPPSIRLAPDQRRTIWLVFEPCSCATDGPPRRVFFRMPVVGAPEIVVKLSDPVASPEWKPRVIRGGIGFAASARSFSGKSSGRSELYPSLPFGLFWWHAPGPVFLRFEAETLEVYEHGPDQNTLSTAEGRGLWLSLDAAWCPPRWLLGVYGGGHWIVGRSGDSSLSRPSRLFGASAGLMVRLSPQWPGRAALRVGYTRLFGVPRPNGLSAALEIPWTFL